MLEMRTTRTYEDAFARARAERAAVFASLFTFRLPSFGRHLTRRGRLA